MATTEPTTTPDAPVDAPITSGSLAAAGGGVLPVDAVEPKPENLHDRVVMSTRKADGTPTEHEIEFIGPVDHVRDAAKVQLTQQAVTRIDEGINNARRVEGSAEGITNPSVQRIADAQKAEIADAESRAEAEVNDAHPAATA